MKFKNSMALVAIVTGLLLAGCGQSGPLYLKASAPKRTNTGSMPAHPNQTTTHPTRVTPGVTSTTNVHATSSPNAAPTVISQQSVA
ncbi:MAG: lipoprotein [Gammaproteobacteria bacterium]|nr:lipoprotein [Gammaproteobacteria bacterium]